MISSWGSWPFSVPNEIRRNENMSNRLRIRVHSFIIILTLHLDRRKNYLTIYIIIP